jgi:acyl-[acyl-carrier-protein]-phospholipid O-acyltransferase/long-chain-fatty-acid--[acyl-carrier-protein] ligase
VILSLLRFLLRLLFGFRAFGTDALRTPGPVLLVPNHVSWIDWLFLGVLLERDWKFVVSSVAANYTWLHRKIMLNRRTFAIDPASPYAAKHMAELLERSGRLVLFAEGQISRTGALMKLYDGTGFLLHKTHARVITCYLRGANRLRWSRQPGWRRWWPRVTAHFSPVLTAPKLENVSVARARRRLTNWLRDQMVRQQFETEMALGPTHLLEAVLAAARATPAKVILQDATMQELTYRRLLLGADLLAGQLGPRLADGPDRVGVLLPNVNAAPVLLLALWSCGKVPAILNFSTGPATMLACAQLAGLKHIVTSNAFLSRTRLKLDPLTDAGIKLIFLEDVRPGISRFAKFAALLRHRAGIGGRLRAGGSADDPAAVLFTSGSEGMPKGVELTHRNLLANIRQMLAIIDITDHDRLFNAMPVFHSFGLTVGTLLGLVRGLYVFQYPTPLHFRIIPNLIYDRHCTVFIATNTFLNGYARKAQSYDFRSLRYLFAGAEKVQEETARVWAQRFGVRILEGYGVTECSPVVSANTPMAPRHGSAGRLVPGMEWKLEPVEGVADAGRLFLRGPNVMRGYLNAEANAQFQALGGWYDTGDIASVDEDGFLFLRGRLKRFAKISGEMVSLTAVEDALAGAFAKYGLRCEVAVVAQPDPDKGEVLVAIANDANVKLEDIRAVLRVKGLPNLCMPREVKYLRDIPKLGTGKVNYRELEKVLQAANAPAGG